MLVPQAEGERMAHRFARGKGLFSGILAHRASWRTPLLAEEVRNATITFVVCDRGDRHLSTDVLPE